MTNTTNNMRDRSRLAALRGLMPQRPLSFGEALRVAELQANRLLELEEHTEAPTPEEIITLQPRLHVERAPFLPGSGRTEWRSGRWCIELNGSEPYLRQRFTLAHEYKHILDAPFDHLIYRNLGDGEASSLVEQVCDYFAACLLMPKRLVKRLWGEGLREPELCQAFIVSPQAMRIRLITLGLIEQPRRCDRPRHAAGSARRPPSPRTFHRTSSFASLAGACP